MKKIFDGIVVSVKMQKTAIVKITTKKPHPLYGKLIKKHKKINADVAEFSPLVGSMVRIIETSPISKTKHFKIMEVIKSGTA